MTDLIQISDDRGVRLIRMNRADKKNALNAPMYDAMAEAIERTATHRAIRCLMIAGAPGALCAGNDLKDLQQAARDDGGLGD